jgi:hypothetical protein
MKTKKGLFIKALKNIEYMTTKYSKIVEALDIDGVCTFAMPTIDIVIELLSEIAGDKEEWVAWWVWDANFGKSDNVVTIDEVDYVIETASDLFNFINNEGI